MYFFSCANAKKIKSYTLRCQYSDFHYEYMNNFTFPHTHTFRSSTYLQYLRCSLPNPLAVEEELDPTGSSECQGWHSCTSKAVKRSHRPLSLNLPPVLIPHWPYSRQPRSSSPCIAFHTPKFNLAEKLTCCITSPGWKSSWHCSPLIIFILRQRDGCIMMYNWSNVHFVQDVFCFLFSLSGIHWTK